MLRNHLFRPLIVISVAGGLLILTWLLVQANSVPVVEPNETFKENDEASSFALQVTEPVTVYLPLVGRNFPPPPPQFGVQMYGINNSRGLTRAIESEVHWVRFAAFQWDEIEPVRTYPNPTYHWEVVDEDSLRNAADNGMEVISVIQFAPDWAQKYPGSYCGPIKEDALDEFAQFLQELVSRYSAPPYNVSYWELGNEPDAPMGYSRSVFGCWGEVEDTYYGGRYYAQMLQQAYPAIKAADPQAQVLLGGLLLDRPSGGSDNSPRFIEGILVGNGGSFFDIVSFHGYPPYDGSLQRDEHYDVWESRGGVVLGKIDFLREVITAYGVDKPLMLTEGSLTCPEWRPDLCNPPDTAFYEAQADYVVWLFVRNWAEGLLGTIWYQFEGQGEWRYSSMLGSVQNPRPAYYTFDFLTEELGGASYKGLVTRYSALRGYEFSAPGKRIWVLWAPDEQLHTITLPSATLEVVYDKYGNDITPTGSSISVNSPIYVELTP